MKARFVLLVLVAALLLGCSKEEEKKPVPARTQAQLVGAAACAPCHAKEHRLWTGSDHQLAMQEAREDTVLGDFDDTVFSYNGIRSRFYRKDGGYFVQTDGEDGQPHDYRIRYTFGIRPLQQYLAEFPRGRYQALSIVWDARPKSAGGQRWIHLYPEEKIDFRDVLHWTGPYQNWNHMCAECHSTNVVKNYNAAEDSFNTTWSEINVSCEQCHGPGSNHVAWAKNSPREKDNGLVVSLKKIRSDFPIDPATGSPVPLPRPVARNDQVEACAQCHSRRTTIREPYVHGRPLADTHLPVLLEEGLYYPDGQIRDEVYEYASFLQSKMFSQGVSCTNCHDPHSGRVVSPDSKVCAQCHMPEKYESASHHHHKPDTEGADCRACHMPVRNYMVVDPRRDHSFRIPRPDLSVKLGTPNACSSCHRDRDAQWAAQHVEQWFGARAPHFAEVIDGSRRYRQNYEMPLAQILEDQTAAGIVRATALVELQRYLGFRSLNLLPAAAGDPDPLIRLACLQTLGAVEPRLRLQLAFPLLRDPLRAVRIRAVGVIAGIPRSDLTAEQQSQWDRAAKEFVEVQTLNADRPDAQFNLGIFYASTGNSSAAEKAYRRALQIQPSMIQAYVNLADLYRTTGAQEQEEAALRKALDFEPENPEARHALGLMLVRQKRPAEALPHFAAAAKNGSNPHYTYVYAVALNSAGRAGEAIALLKDAAGKFPGNREILYGIVAFARDAGDARTAGEYAGRLQRLYPESSQ